MNQSFIERGGGWVVGQSVLLLAVIGLGVAFPGNGMMLPLVPLGAVLFGLSGIIGLAGVIALGGNLTSFPKPLPNARLVQRGVYQHMRHPLYTSVMLASLGWGLIWQSWVSLLAAVILILLLDVKARREERWLRTRFPEYAGYEQRVRRFVPWVY